MSFSYLEISGFVFLVYFLLYKPLFILYRWYRNRNSNAYETILKPGPNEYAVITGSTDGIGLEYARQLAEKGYSLLLLSRTKEKLKQVASEIQKQYLQCKKVETLAVDFSRTDIYDLIKQKLELLDGRIHVLVNNVGTAHVVPEYFANYPEGFNLRLINVNIVSMTAMSEIVLKMWTTQKGTCPVDKRPKGVIINISSIGGATEMPLVSTYSASKSYMNYLSKMLSIEYAKDNILVQTVMPGQVATSMVSEMRNRTAVPAKDFVAYALKTVGSEQTTNAHPKHKLVNNSMLFWKSVLPEKIYYGFAMGITSSVRAEYNAKKQKC